MICGLGCNIPSPRLRIREVVAPIRVGKRVVNCAFKIPEYLLGGSPMSPTEVGVQMTEVAHCVRDAGRVDGPDLPCYGVR